MEALERIEPPDTTTHSVEKNTSRAGQTRNPEHRTQPRATEHRRTKRPTSQQQPHRTKRIRPNNDGKTTWSEPVTPPAPFPLPPAELAQTSDTRLIRRLFRDTSRSKHKLFLVVAPPTPWETTDKARPTWQLIQVDWTKTNAHSAKTEGTYLARRFRLHPDDVISRAPVDCRFSPDIWEWMPTQNTHVPRYVKHERFALAAQKNPHLKWPLQPFSLTQDLIAGPIDFIPRKPPTYTQRCLC